MDPNCHNRLRNVSKEPSEELQNDQVLLEGDSEQKPDLGPPSLLLEEVFSLKT